MTILMSTLLLTCLVLLSLQVLLIRQIGILSSRMGPEKESHPSRTKVEAIEFLDGGLHSLQGSSATPLLIVSVGCHLCVRVLTDLASRGVPERLRVGILGGPEEIEDLVARLHLARGAFFDAKKLAADLEVSTVPVFLLIDPALNVLHRSFVDSMETAGVLLEKWEPHGTEHPEAAVEEIQRN